MGALEGLKGSRYVYDEELCVSVKLPTCSRSSGDPHGFSSTEGWLCTSHSLGLHHGTWVGRGT